eukprot:UN12836
MTLDKRTKRKFNFVIFSTGRGVLSLVRFLHHHLYA